MLELIQGQKVKLSQLTSRSSVNVRVHTQGTAVKVVLLGLNTSGQLSDSRHLVSETTPTALTGAQWLNPPGLGIDFTRLPSQTERLAVCLYSDQPMDASTTFTLTLEESNATSPLARYASGRDQWTGLRSVILGEMYLKDGWRFSAIGQGLQGGLDRLIHHFGGNWTDVSGHMGSPLVSPKGTSSVSISSTASTPPHGIPTSSNSGEPGAHRPSWTQPTLTNTGHPNPVGGSVTRTLYRIYGDDMQIIEIELSPGESVRAEAGAMLYMREGIEMQTTLDRRGSSGGLLGGLLSGLSRVVAGESFFITTFTHTGQGKSHVAFAAPYPGKIIPLNLDEQGGTFMCQRDAFLCGAESVDVNVAFTKRLGAGFFGGEGFILQRLTGSGLAFIHAGGTIVEKVLSPGEVLRVDTGCIVGFAPTVTYDIQFVGGFRNALFGGEGVFLATLRGPGLVYLQSLPLSRLAERIRGASFGGNSG